MLLCEVVIKIDLTKWKLKWLDIVLYQSPVSIKCSRNWFMHSEFFLAYRQIDKVILRDTVQDRVVCVPKNGHECVGRLFQYCWIQVLFW